MLEKYLSRSAKQANAVCLYSATSKITSSSNGVPSKRLETPYTNPARALVFQPEDFLQEHRSWLIDQNRGARAKQLDEGIVDTFVLGDVFGGRPVIRSDSSSKYTAER